MKEVNNDIENGYFRIQIMKESDTTNSTTFRKFSIPKQLFLKFTTCLMLI